MSSKPTKNSRQMKYSSERSQQLIDPASLDPKRLVFSDVVEGTVPNSVVKFRRISMAYQNDDGTLTDVLLPTPRLFSYGIGENTDPQTKKVTGYSLPLILFSKDGATKEETDFLKGFQAVVEAAKHHLVKEDVKASLNKDWDLNDLKKIASCLYYKKEQGKIVEGASPTLYTKLISTSGGKKKGKDTKESKEDEHPKIKILSQFYSEKDNQPIDPMTLTGRYGHVRAVVKIESIYDGSKTTLQVKLYEAVYDPIESTMKSLLVRNNNPGILLNSKFPKKEEETKAADEEDGEKAGSVENSEDEGEKEVEKKVEKKPPVRKITTTMKAKK